LFAETIVDTDPMLRRLERTAFVACLVMAIIALVVAGGRAGAAIAVLAGGLLAGVSYWTIGSGVNRLVTSLTHADGGAAPPPSRGFTVARIVARYALLTLLAYVMIARLRLHPLGLLAGASSVVAAAAVEALRLSLKKP
jgi:hypothetical protein